MPPTLSQQLCVIAFNMILAMSILTRSKFQEVRSHTTVGLLFSRIILIKNYDKVLNILP